ncbi:hypothetical protein [Hyphococcus sp.]|jgi:hypothetical protein|uniref:hypothetical protein n=1 Tax=Hyphococcus sp. TaxID=2038636 RepID=UPI003D1066F3
MSVKGKPPAVFAALGKGAGSVFSRLPFAARFSAKNPAPAPVSRFAPLDPTVALFPGEAADGQATDDLSFSLDYRLSGAAANVEGREAMLQSNAIALKNVSDDRAGGEKSLTIWGVRFLIALGWLGLGFWLSQSALYARANGLETAFGGTTPEDAVALSEPFLLAGGVGAAAAILMIAFVFLRGDATNDRLRRRSEAFGDELAREARKLNAALKSYRDKVVASASGAAGVAAASQAHLTALEAAYFFRNISFLTTVNADSADDAYQRFLHRYCPSASGYSFADIVVAIILGTIVGLGLGRKLFKPAAEGAEPLVLAIMDYPWAVQALVYGGLVYLLTGITMEFFSGVIGRREMSKARKDALDSMRSAYTAQEAPLESEVVRQVEDVVAILAARLGGAGTGAGKTNHSGTDFSADAAEPEWRRRDSSVKFVDAGFSPAPESWRTDAFSKKFEAQNLRGSGAKRGGEAFKNKPRD